MHDTSKDGTQQIDYVIDCSKQTMALAGFTVISTNGKLTSTVPGSSPSTLALYRPVIDHEKNNAKHMLQIIDHEQRQIKVNSLQLQEMPKVIKYSYK